MHDWRFLHGDKRLSDTVSYTDNIQPHKLNLLFAGVGSGKNYFVNQLIKGYEDTHHDGSKVKLEPMTVLVITSRRSKVDELLTEDDLPADGKVGLWDDYHQIYDDEFLAIEATGKYIRIENEYGLGCTVFQRSVVCTNAFIERYMQYHYRPLDATTHLWELFDLIVIDEAHSLVLDASYQSAPFYVMELINEFCARHQAAADDPEKHKAPRCGNLLLMTGSEEPLRKLPLPMEPNVIDRMEQCRNVRPENIHFLTADEAHAQLIQQLKNGEKAVYFTNHTPDLDDFLEGTDIDPAKVAVSFSKKEKRDKMAKDDPEAFARMVRVEAAVANDKHLPKDIHLWLTTSRNKEGINIENEDIAHLYVESHIQSDIIQMAGRIRTGVEHMYVIVDAQDNHATEWKYLAEFSRTYLVTSVNAAGSIDDACNAMLETICLDNEYTGLFNQRDAKVTAYQKKGCKDVRDCIDFFHDVFPHARYSYIDNVFRYYHMREVSKRLQATELRVFKRAKDESGKLEKLFKRWFPTSTVHPYVPSEEAQNAAARDYLINEMGLFKVGRRFTQEERDAMTVRLNEIYGTKLTSLNSLIKKCVSAKLEQVSRNSGTTCYGLYHCVPLPNTQVQEPTATAA